MSAASAVTDFAGDVVGGAADAVGDVVGGAVDAVSDVGSSVDDFVNEEIPGGWVTVGLAAAGASGAFTGADAAAATAADDVAAMQAAANSMSGAQAGAGLSMPFSEVMELPVDELLSGYEAAAAAVPGYSGIDIGDTIPYTEEQIAGLYPIDNAFVPPDVPVVDMSTAATGALAVPGLTDTLAGAAIGGAVGGGAGSAIEDALTPNAPQAPQAKPPKVYTPDWSIQFDAPVQFATARRAKMPVGDGTSMAFERITPVMPLPEMLDAGNHEYTSAMIESLRNSADVPVSANTGLTFYQAVTK